MLEHRDHDVFCNYNAVKEADVCEAEQAPPGITDRGEMQVWLTNSLMDIIDGEPPGKLRWIGKIWKDNEYTFVPDQETVDRCQVIKICEALFQEVFPKVHGVLLAQVSDVYLISDRHYGQRFSDGTDATAQTTI